MSDQEIMVLGFQASGKTTFAAALWHLVGSREINETALVMGKHNGDFRYLDEISGAWAGGGSSAEHCQRSGGRSRLISGELFQRWTSGYRSSTSRVKRLNEYL